MRIAIPASGPTINDPVDTRFGRAPYLIFVTPENGDTSSMVNPHANSACHIPMSNPHVQEVGGVGSRVVQLLVLNEVTHLIAQRIGGNAETALLAAGIQVFQWEGMGSVSSALEQFKARKLTQILGKNPSS